MDHTEQIARRLLGNRRFGALKGAHPHGNVVQAFGLMLAARVNTMPKRARPADWTPEFQAALKAAARTLDAALRDGAK